MDERTNGRLSIEANEAGADPPQAALARAELAEVVRLGRRADALERQIRPLLGDDSGATPANMARASCEGKGRC